jgi:O-antigen biosynthesis alpha-1,3-rhamnosyltransferase
MRVALNVSILRAPRTGIGHYVAELCEALRGEDGLELELYGGWNWGGELPSAPMPGYSRLSNLIKDWVPQAYRLRRAVEQLGFSRGVRRLRPALYHEPSLWPFEFDGPMLMTLHDLAHVHYPHTQPADRLREIERHVQAGLQRATSVLVDSQFVADEARRHYGIAAEKLVVAPLGYAERFRPRTDEDLAPLLATMGLLPRQYLLCVGTLEPRKNLELALSGYMALPEAIRNRHPLLLAGMSGWHTERLQGCLRMALSTGQVRLLGYQPDEQLAELLAGARMLLFPSLYEGFGLPVLEAMASGTPVVLGRNSALPGVAGEAGCYIEDPDPQVYAHAIRQLIEDQPLWQRLREAGLERARLFSWRRCAQITAGVYREVIS